MSRGPSFLVSTCLSAVALLATGPLLPADPSDQDASSGYKTVLINVGGQKVPIRVKQQFDPIKNPGALADPLDHQKVFSETNAMANKSFMSGAGNAWNKTSDLKLIDAYATKPYFNDAASAPGYGSKAVFRNSAFDTHATTGLDKSFPTSTASAGQDQAAAAFAAIGAREQNRTAPIDGKPVETNAAPIGNKTFLGPEADAVHHRLTPLPNGGYLVQNLPNRPLTIDEVKDLINHGFKPDTSLPPPMPSKPLNDPDYQPEPLREDPAGADSPAPKNASDIDDDKDDAIPPPGTMATPENAEPLPKK